MSKHITETARSIMHHPVHTVRVDEPVVSAARRLGRKGCSGAPVVDAEGKVVGILSEADVVPALASAAFYEAPPPTLVGDIMQAAVKTVTPEADVFQLVSAVGSGAHKRVPVVVDGKPIGIVTRRDVMRALLKVVDERWGERIPTTYDSIAATEGTHNPFPRG